jgi:hypothetical protein
MRRLLAALTLCFGEKLMAEGSRFLKYLPLLLDALRSKHPTLCARLRPKPGLD